MKKRNVKIIMLVSVCLIVVALLSSKMFFLKKSSNANGTVVSKKSISKSERDRENKKVMPNRKTNKVLWVVTNDTEDSFHSASLVYSYCRKSLGEKQVQLINIDKITMRMDMDGLSIYYKGEKQQCPKVVWCRINSEDLLVDRHVTLFRHLELMGAKVINNTQGILKCTNKAWHLQDLALHGVPIATTLTNTSPDTALFDNVDDALSYPIVYKTVRGNGGNGVILIKDEVMQDELSGILVKDWPFIYQQYIEESHGQDLRVIIVDGKPIYSMVRKSNTPSFRANLTQGGHADIVTGKYPDAEELAIKICSILDLEVAGVDLLFSNEHGYICCEVNNSPGFSKAIYKGHEIEKHIGDMLIKYLVD